MTPSLYRFTLVLVGGFCLPAAVAGQKLPETPALSPEVVATRGGQTVAGHVSARRSTHDGRVRVIGSSPTAKRWFYTSRAEVFRRHLAEEARTSDGDRLVVDPALFHRSTLEGAVPGHIEICDPYLAAGARLNPYACGSGEKADCYDVSVILAINAPATPDRRAAIELWSTPVTVAVRSPKTPKADVSKVEIRGEPVRAPFTRAPRRSGENLLEPVTSGDGRLLIANSGDTLLYSVMDETAMPCDARGWKRLSHLSRAHADSKMSRYGLARYAIRDTENRRVKTGKPIRGAYPWIDRGGNNLFFTQVGRDGLFYIDRDGKRRSRFEIDRRPRRRQVELGGATRFGMSWVGLWSEGKVIVPDTRVNNVDFHTGARGYRPRVRIYDGGGQALVELERSPIVDLNSPESQWNYRTAFLPRTPRDVVWWLSASQGITSEVVFDDALDAGTLIYSPMNASVDNKRRSYRDGFDPRRGGYVKNPRIQNAAASTRQWELPRFGRLTGARVEPIAAGGVAGTGLWLDGVAGRLEYAIPAQTRAEEMTQAVWTTTLALDPRGSAGRSRLLTFPDGTWVDLAGSRLVLGGGGGPERPVTLPGELAPANRRWSHLAFVSTPGFVDVLVDGFRLATVPGVFLRPGPGTLIVGATAAGDATAAVSFRGWLDELRVVAGERDPETLCNYAGGTLRGVDSTERPGDFAATGLYPAESHDAVSALLAATGRRTYERYRCERERAATDGTNACLDAVHRFAGVPESCVGPALRFPEGPLFSDRPRPDSRANASCLSCHLEGHPTPTLRRAAPLRSGQPDTALSDDPRRQPHQAPRRLHGVVPRELLGLPDDVAAPLDGLLLDPFLYPSADHRFEPPIGG